jgi:hypothetical protein
MRKIEYLSPSSIGVFNHDPREFYLRYLSDDRPERMPQTQPMSIGSAFDAFVKSHLHISLFGVDNDPKYALDALFEAQVEEQHRDWARQHGAYVFDQYRQTGALADLMLELKKAQSPRFEFEVRGAVHGYREGVQAKIANVTFLGKPDVSFVSAEGRLIILDFKVNGYCSQTTSSPMGGYVRMRAAGKTNFGQHKDCKPMMIDGMLINTDRYLEDYNKTWAAQLAIYGWLCGNPVGKTAIVAIDQISCSPGGVLPSIRVAEHRIQIGASFQQKLFDRACEIWEIVHSDHFFRNMSKAESQACCQALDGHAAALRGSGSVDDDWFAQVTRGF